MAQSMRGARKKVQPGVPQSLSFFGETCQQNPRYGFVDGLPFCRGSIGPEGAVSVLFVSEQMKNLLSTTRELHIDGTFKTRPRHPKSGQLLTIIAIQYGIVCIDLFLHCTL